MMIKSPNEVIQHVEKYYGFSAGALIDKDRSATLAEARQTAMYLIQKHTLRSNVEIGDALHRHHSTVIHGVRAVKKRMLNNAAYKERVLEISYELSKDNNKKLIQTL